MRFFKDTAGRSQVLLSVDFVALTITALENITLENRRPVIQLFSYLKKTQIHTDLYLKEWPHHQVTGCLGRYGGKKELLHRNHAQSVKKILLRPWQYFYTIGV